MSGVPNKQNQHHSSVTSVGSSSTENKKSHLLADNDVS